MPSPFSTKGCDANGRWSRPPDGFSYLWPAQNAYQFVPVGQSRALSLKTDHRPWTLTAVDLTMSGGIDVRLNARKTVIGPFQTYALEPGMKYPLDLTGNAEAALALVMSTPGEADKPLLYAHAGGTLTVHYAVNIILRDCSQTLEQYSRSELLTLLREVETSYAQANIRLVRVGPIHLLELKTMSLGPQIITDSRHGDLIRDHIKASGRGHLKNLVYGWDFESEPKPPNAANLSSGLTEFGGNVCFIDWGNRSMVTAHELGHALRLIDRPRGDITIMQPQRSSAPFIPFDYAQIEVLRMVAKQVA
jgi:hypothetical protein